MINPVSLIPAQYKIAAIGIGLVVVVAVSGGTGFAYGVDWNADDLAECKLTIKQVKDQQDELIAENARIEAASKQALKQTADGWAAAVSHLRRTTGGMRVADCRDPAAPEIRTAAGESTQAAGESGHGAGLRPPVTISIGEANRRLDNAALDAAQILWMLEHDAVQAEIARQ